jgi:hypothetical protein
MLQALLLVAGLGVVGYLVVRIGVPTVWSALHTLSWWLLLVVVFLVPGVRSGGRRPGMEG